MNLPRVKNLKIRGANLVLFEKDSPRDSPAVICQSGANHCTASDNLQINHMKITIKKIKING
jgi:hypothetical protein